ncbi:MAG: molybdopterin-dependent oxidoreductase [Deltaproteobacteria bacterium]|nr:MAG: molybdopterin-dependent oxidoreductase [Deltaproteobacteria bacterium]
MSTGFTRREVLRAGAAGTLALGLSNLSLGAPAPDAAVAAPSRAYGDWRDVYRRRFTWERIARGTHTNTNCVSSCAWNLYVREGIVFREEQMGSYAASNDTVPDFNPRGCNKGACASDLFLGPSRLLHPLRRVGPRGAGRWKRISWDAALDEIADALVEELSERGGEGVICELGPNVDFGPNSVAPLRFFRLLGSPVTDSMAMIGDLPVGGTITLGTPHTDGTSDDWFRSRYLVLWAFNPAVARIPDAHFLNEARYRGARVVAIAPDYNQSSIHSDLWLSPSPGTDAALALAACQVVVSETLYDADYVREQTDLPFLVRTDSGRFLRESDVQTGGSETRFAVWDEAADQLAWAPGSEGDGRRTLELVGVRPALFAARTVALAGGGEAPVETVMERLRRQLDASHRPEQAAAITGVAADTIRRFARDFATAEAALILSQWGSCKNYHSDLIQRAQILLASLTGNLGRVGGGWRSGAFIALEGFALLAMQEKLSIPQLLWLSLRSRIWPDAVRKEFESGYVSSTLFHAVHGGLADIGTQQAYGDPALEAGAAPHLRAAVDSGQFPIGPPADAEPPRVILSIFGNVLRHARSYPKLRERLFEPAHLVVDVNFRISETGRNADILLPAAGWYEKVGLKYIAAFVPHLTLGDRAVPPRGESKPEWEIFSRLSERVAARARAREMTAVPSWRGEPRDLTRLDAAFSDAGRFGPHDQEALVDFILSVSTASRGITLEDLRREGAVRIRSLGPQGGTANIYSEYAEDEPVVPLRDFVEKKQPYPTLTGRQQFYVDHPLFLQLGEALPTHKPPPAAGGDHPLVLTGAHTRWSIHAQWRDEGLLLRLQRGEPVVYLNPRDASARGIADGNRIVVRNDLGAFVAMAKPTGAIRPGQAHIFHAWEPYQFIRGVSHQALSPSPLKVTQLVGDYGQLHWGYGHYEPNQVDRDTRVEVELYDGASVA